MATNTCQYKFLEPTKTCPYPPLDSDTLCLFHSQDHKKDANTFWNGIQEKLNKQDFDFEGYYFPAGLSLNLSRRKFKNANFCHATFKESVSFVDSKFTGKYTSFAHAKFLGKETIFGRADFIGRSVVFSDAHFQGKLVRLGANFSANTFFVRTKFLAETTTFVGATFSNDRTNFMWAVFRGKCVDFRLSQFAGKSIDFSGAEFSGNTDFMRAKFSGEEVVFHSVGLENCRFYDTDLRKVKFIRCDFASQEGYRPFCLIRQRLNLSPQASGGVGLLSRIDEKISSWTARTNILRDEIDTGDQRGENPREVLKRYALVARSYQQLKRYFQDEEKDYARAGEFFYGEMECRRKAGQHRPFLHLYWAFSGYGERYLRAFLWLFFYIFLLFPFLYYITANNAYETKIDYDEFRECLLYSLNVITLRGTEATQSFSFRLCSTLEMIFGLIQSALFFMALRSKLRR